MSVNKNKINLIEILERLIVKFRAEFEMSPDCQKAAIEELRKYIKFDFNDLDELRGRWNILTNDKKLAEKRIIYDLDINKAKAHLARCRARISANIAFGRKLKKLKTEGG